MKTNLRGIKRDVQISKLNGEAESLQVANEVRWKPITRANKKVGDKKAYGLLDFGIWRGQLSQVGE